MYIAIEGNAATGKTSLAEAVSALYGFRQILEPSVELLTPLHASGEVSPLRMQLECLVERVRMQKLIQRERARVQIVTDCVFVKDLVYAELYLAGGDFETYRRIYGEFEAQTPDLLIYLTAPLELLMQRIHARSRSYEKNITTEFIQRLQTLCDKHVLTSRAKRIERIDTSSLGASSEPLNTKDMLADLRLTLDFLQGRR